MCLTDYLRCWQQGLQPLANADRALPIKTNSGKRLEEISADLFILVNDLFKVTFSGSCREKTNLMLLNQSSLQIT